MNVPLTYRKRIITQNDLSFILKIINEYRSEGRSAISRKLCEVWDWRQANGQLKDGVCRGLLLQLERNQLITLPPRIIDNNNNSQRRRISPATFDFQPDPITSTLSALTPIELRQVRRTPEEKLFNALIRQYHYLGYAQPVGEHLKYLVYAGTKLLACLCFSSAPYAIDCRDIFLGWSREARERNRHLLAYNTRFLIMPWVRVPHLASHLLGRIAIGQQSVFDPGGSRPLAVGGLVAAGRHDHDEAKGHHSGRQAHGHGDLLGARRERFPLRLEEILAHDLGLPQRLACASPSTDGRWFGEVSTVWRTATYSSADCPGASF